jgi:hypothetical protein
VSFVDVVSWGVAPFAAVADDVGFIPPHVAQIGRLKGAAVWFVRSVFTIMSQPRTADQQIRYQKRVDELLAMLKEQGELHKQVDNAAEWAKLKEKHGDSLTIKQCYPALGQKVLEDIATNFYDAVYADDANWFADQFRNASPKEEAILNQWTFFVEHMGGPKVCYILKSKSRNGCGFFSLTFL